MTPKIRLSPNASSANRPASSSPLMSASTKKMSSWQSILFSSTVIPEFREAKYPGPRLVGTRHLLESWVPALGLAARGRDDKSNPHVGLADLVAGGKLGGGARHLDAADFEQI